ncbi:dolichol-phosphate mannosyltransferase [Leptolyngbya sp. Heron Island J]|uniref:LA_3751/LA_3752 family putative glycosyltransferase n=1 Tax=Leptolyngbya sp. Heron Island J TaxID=1385935 RepID=UPI0003B9ABDA|nr:hypothetical protein [Leptolyngbya sp. Heron Island J]ESA34928.1 dolichol-phosphate mannosyltransferase [Leptolyngbya sp. Heron Island J]
MLKSRKWLSWLLPGLVLIVGIGLSLGLQFYSRDGVFFSGDAGLKALLSQQFSAGKWQTSLDLPQPAWVLTLWRQGLYPFAPPYVYEQQGNYFITFPFIFPAITAPFYRLIGYHGLYVVPLISLWVTWLRLWQVCRVWRIHSAIIALSLGLVILASPLTLYGAIYWEHTLAIALAFWGVSGLLIHLLPAGQTDRISLNEALVNGVCVGLAVWLRPELLCLAIILAALVVASRIPQIPTRWRVVIPRGLTLGLVVAFTGAMSLTILGLLGMNGVIYGRTLGMYAIESSVSIGQRATQIWHNYSYMVVALLRYFPAWLLALALPWWMGGRARAASIVLITVGSLFAIAVPLIAPSSLEDPQWGPRLYLILVPITGLIIAAGLQHLWPIRQKRWQTLAAIALVMALGIHINLINGGLKDYYDPQTNSISLSSNRAPVAPAIAALASYNEPWVAMSHQQVAHQLWPSLRFKTFFRTETETAVTQLAAELVNQGESSFLYLCEPDISCLIPNQGILRSNQFGNDNTAMRISFRSLGTFGKYSFYRGLINVNQ